MKRDFLKELGIDEEVVNRIMAENGRDIEAAKGELDSARNSVTAMTAELEGYKTQLAQRNADIETLKEGLKDSNAVKSTLEELQQKYQQETEAFKTQLEQQQIAFTREKATDAFFKDVQFSSQLARDAAVAQFKAKNFTLDNGNFVGASEWINSLRESMPDAFKTVTNEPGGTSAPMFTKPMGQSNSSDPNPFTFGFQKIR